MSDSPEQSSRTERQSLPVLPHSGKVEELKKEPLARTPLDFGHAMHTSPADLSPALRSLEATIVEVLRTVYDPEIPVNIYELGLIYEINIDEQSEVKVKMTLTSPACPVAGSLPGEVERRSRASRR